MILYPKKYLKNVKEVSIDLLAQNNIKGLILDVDNTLIDFDRQVLDGIEDWKQIMEDNGIKMCIVSNTNKIDKVKKVADLLNIEYINFAKKPSRGGFIKAMKVLQLEASQIAVIGDQIMTDVLGGNRMKMYTILTEPIDKRDIFITRVKRPIERIIISRYLRRLERK